jgi:hypothetical protein
MPSFNFALGIVSLGVALAMIFFGQRNASRMMKSGLLFVGYPAIVVVFVALGCALLVTSF